MPNWSCPAGTGVWVVKTQHWAIAVTSCSVARLERRSVEALLQQPDAEQRGVALVHVVDLGLEAEGAQQGYATEAEHGLLTEAVVGVSAVEVVGEAAVVGIVAFEVGVEQKDGDDVAGDADNVKTPGADGDFAALHGDGRLRPALGRVVSGDQGTSDSVCWPTASRCWRK